MKFLLLLSRIAELYDSKEWHGTEYSHIINKSSISGRGYGSAPLPPPTKYPPKLVIYVSQKSLLREHKIHTSRHTLFFPKMIDKNLIL
jgi:hypothetical protein